MHNYPDTVGRERSCETYTFFEDRALPEQVGYIQTSTRMHIRLLHVFLFFESVYNYEKLQVQERFRN